MPTYQELLDQHTLVNDKYSKLFAASKSIAKKLNEMVRSRTEVRKSLHGIIGPLLPGTLVMNHTGTRFYEITEMTGSGTTYRAKVIYQTNGEQKMEGKGTIYVYSPTKYLEAGSVVPVPPTHKVALKHTKRRMRDTLEGKT